MSQIVLEKTRYIENLDILELTSEFRDMKKMVEDEYSTQLQSLTEPILPDVDVGMKEIIEARNRIAESLKSGRYQSTDRLLCFLQVLGYSRFGIYLRGILHFRAGEQPILKYEIVKVRYA